MTKGGDTHGSEGGITVTELLVYMTLSFVVVGAAVSLLIAQSRHARRQFDVTDVRETLRSAAAALAWEIQQASASRGDLIAIGSQSLVMRSIEGSATVCAIDSLTNSYGLWQPLGRFVKNGGDSLLVYDAGLQQWVAHEIVNLKPGPGGGPLSSCAWSGPRAPGVLVKVKSVSGIPGQIGSPVQKFRVVEYGVMNWSDRWWLGRRVSGASFEVLTGPLATPPDSGVVLHYYDAAGAATAVSTSVHRLSLRLRAESQDSLAERRDSAYATVFLRNQ